MHVLPLWLNCHFCSNFHPLKKVCGKFSLKTKRGIRIRPAKMCAEGSSDVSLVQSRKGIMALYKMLVLFLLSLYALLFQIIWLNKLMTLIYIKIYNLRNQKLYHKIFLLPEQHKSTVQTILNSWQLRTVIILKRI